MEETPSRTNMYLPGEKIRTIRTSNTFTIEGSTCGGLGIVLFARREKDSRIYALKTFRKWDKEDERVIDHAILFHRESLVWITLGKQKNIVQALWYDHDEDYRPFLIMEYIRGDAHGVSMRDRLKVLGKLQPAEAVYSALETLDGIAYAKSVINRELDCPFIHRDIKPDNLLITREGTLKVSDFGLVLGGGGTAHYRAPEQWEGNEIEEKSDVYSLGCVLFEMLEGHPPFGGLGHKIRRNHQEAPPPPLTNIPNDLNQIIQWCLAKSPDARPGFTGLQEELKRLFNSVLGETYHAEKAPRTMTAEDQNARGSGFSRLGYHEKAVECFSSAIQLDPRDDRFYLNRGNARLNMGDYSNAERDYIEALTLAPKSEKARVSLGNLFAQKGELEKALECYYHALEDSPEEPMIYVNIGIVFAFQDRVKDAEKYFRKALDIRSNQAEAFLGLGNVRFCEEDFKGARDFYLTAIDKNPLYLNAYLSLAQLYHSAGFEKERDEMMRMATRLKPLREIAERDGYQRFDAEPEPPYLLDDSFPGASR